MKSTLLLKLAGAFAAAGVAAMSAHAAVHTFPITMTGAEEVPGPGDPDGAASGVLTIDDSTNTISWTFNYANIDPPTAMHIHTGAAGVGGGVFVGLGIAGSPGVLMGSVGTTAANVAAILNNPTGFYVNVHNVPFGPGAVRGQIPKVFNLTMSGDQEVPGPGDPDGMASGPLWFDTGSNTIGWEFTYSNLDPVTAMHIHTGAIGVGGGVFVGLGTATTGGPGTLFSMTSTSAANMNAILSNPGGFYVNIHTTTFGPGAVRGQVDGSLPMAPCPSDLDGDGATSASDLAQLLGAWGGGGPADLNNDGTVGAADLAAMLGSWGPCP